MRNLMFPGLLMLLLSACGHSEPTKTEIQAATTFEYEAAVDNQSPWPTMRRTSRNTGSSPVRARYHGDAPWFYPTGKGIFSTPVIGRDGSTYVGSADRYFYALDPAGRLRWRFETGEIIDSSASIGAFDPVLSAAPVTFGSGDEFIYRLRPDDGLDATARVVWKFEANQAIGSGQLVNWWEGNVTTGPDGVMYAGNTGGAAYAINPDGSFRWAYTAQNSVWSNAAIDGDGNTYWTSLDAPAQSFFSLDPSGALRWASASTNFVTSSPAIGSDGTIYAGGFDGAMNAMNPDTGLKLWSFTTRDHIYPSVAVLDNADGVTTALYFGSADGVFYALDPDGAVLWTYDVGDVIRGSAAIGRSPVGDGAIVYFGTGNGKIYALDATTGTRRWSFNTTSDTDELRDRNDLNASVALSLTGIHVAGEHGQIWYVPYDYCLYAVDARCETDPGEEFADEVQEVFRVTPGGNTVTADAVPVVPASTMVATRLIVREGGANQGAGIVDLNVLGNPAGYSVETTPSVAVTTYLSGDGQYLFIAPDEILAPDTEYELAISGDYTADNGAGTFADTLRIRTAAAQSDTLPLAAGAERVAALEWRRLALPLPPLLPSVNQIGFDSYNWIMGTVRVERDGDEGRFVLWVIGGRHNAQGELVPAPGAGFLFPLSGSFKRDFYRLTATDLTLVFSFGPVPVRKIEMRGQLLPDGRSASGAVLYSEVNCPEVPTYGPILIAIGECNRDLILLASGTYLTRAYDGTANARPAGLSVSGLQYTAPGPVAEGSVMATLSGAFPADRHIAALLLVDDDTGQAVALDYAANTQVAVDDAGNITSVTLMLPAATSLPPNTRVYVMADVFPLASEML